MADINISANDDGDDESDEIPIAPAILVDHKQLQEYESPGSEADKIPNSDPEYTPLSKYDIPMSSASWIIPETDSSSNSDKENSPHKIHQYGSSVIGSDGDFRPSTDGSEYIGDLYETSSSDNHTSKISTLIKQKKLKKNKQSEGNQNKILEYNPKLIDKSIANQSSELEKEPDTCSVLQTKNDNHTSTITKPKKFEKKIKAKENQNKIIEYNSNLIDEPFSNQSSESEKEPDTCHLMQSKNVTGIRKWDKIHGCVYCGKGVKKLAVHLELHHKDEVEVREFTALPKKTKERRDLIEKLRQKGNYIYNSKIIKGGKGYVIPKRRQNANVTKKQEIENYVPCNNCLGFYQKKTIYSHFKKCMYNHNPNKSNSSNRFALFPVSDEASLLLKENVLSKMSQDKIFHVIRSDNLILKYGSQLYTKHGTEKHLHNFVAQKMREVGRLLLALRQINPSIMSLTDIYAPQNFNDFLEGVKSVASFDETTNSYGIPSLATKLGTAIKYCAGLLKSESIIEGNTEKRSNIDDFLYLYETHWKIVSSHALKTAYKKKWNTTDKLPLASDIQKLSDYLKNTASMIMKKKAALDQSEWRKLCDVTITQTILFNRRRAGEVERALLKYYLMADKIAIPQDEENALTNTEKNMSRDLLRFEVQGKRGRKVPIILTRELQNQYDVIISNRAKFGVPHDNSYIFARPNSKDPIKAGIALECFSKICGASNPENLRSTKLRKQIATACQLLNLKENEMDQVASYMGHDIRVHRQFYRLPESTTQLTKISKLLMSMDEGSLISNRGKNLDTIELKKSNTTSIDDITTILAPHDAGLRPVTSNNNEVMEEELNTGNNGKETISNESDSSGDKIAITRRKIKKRTITKTPWTEAEKEAVLNQLQDCIILGKVPEKQQCDTCIAKERTLSNRTWTQVKYFVYNEIKRRGTMSKEKVVTSEKVKRKKNMSSSSE